MNTFMWDHPLTASHISILTKFGYIQIPPVSKLLACGDQGIWRYLIVLADLLSFLGVGAMASVDDIVKSVIENL